MLEQSLANDVDSFGAECWDESTLLVEYTHVGIKIARVVSFQRLFQLDEMVVAGQVSRHRLDQLTREPMLHQFADVDAAMFDF